MRLSLHLRRPAADSPDRVESYAADTRKSDGVRTSASCRPSRIRRPPRSGAARVRRRMTVEEVAARTGLPVDDIRSLEEGRIYRFPSVSDAIAATLLIATALGMTEREARGIAGVDGGGRSGSTRVFPALAFVVLAGLLAWFVAVPQLRDATGAEQAAPWRHPRAKLPPPWEVRVDVFNGTEVVERRHAARERDRRPARLPARHRRERRAPRLRADARLLPGGQRGARPPARRRLGVPIQALPGGGESDRLV